MKPSIWNDNIRLVLLREGLGMAFCSVCGKELSASSMFCTRCGTPVKQVDLGPEMSHEESMVYIYNLREKLANIEKLEREVAENERKLQNPIPLNYSSYSFFRFYWPYLAGAAAVYLFLDIILMIVSTGGTDGATAVFAFLAITAPVTILVSGIFIARNRRNKENLAISMGNERAIEQRRKLEESTAELKSQLSAARTDLTVFNKAVPEKLCTTNSIAKMNALIQSGRASSLQEAVRMMD